MRDYSKLSVFQKADRFVLALYGHTSKYPDAERYGLVSQMRRAGVSILSNIVEGCARSSTREYLRFLEIAYGSACEVKVQLSLSRRLDFGDAKEHAALSDEVDGICAQLAKLSRALDPER